MIYMEIWKAVSVKIDSDRIEYIGISVNAGFEAYVISTGPQKVQVHFIGNTSQIPSWVLCELNSNPKCSFG